MARDTEILGGAAGRERKARKAEPRKPSPGRLHRQTADTMGHYLLTQDDSLIPVENGPNETSHPGQDPPVIQARIDTSVRPTSVGSILQEVSQEPLQEPRRALLHARRSSRSQEEASDLDSLPANRNGDSQAGSAPAPASDTPWGLEGPLRARSPTARNKPHQVRSGPDRLEDPAQDRGRSRGSHSRRATPRLRRRR